MSEQRFIELPLVWAIPVDAEYPEAVTKVPVRVKCCDVCMAFYIGHPARHYRIHGGVPAGATDA